MSKFHATQHGSLWVTTTDGFTEDVNTLKVFCRGAADSTNLQYDPTVLIEVMKVCKGMIGPNFKAFLEENFKNGLARRANLVTEIIRYLNGEVSYRAVTTQLQIMENEYLQRVNKSINFIHTLKDTPVRAQLPKGFDKITNQDFYRLIECLGPVKIASLFLILSGDTFYAIRR